VPAGLARLAAALVAAALLLSVLAAPSAAGAPAHRDVEQDTGEAPLAVTIDSITPSTVPRSGDVTLTGEITNRSKSDWTDLRVYLFMSSTPMTTSAELREATATPETAFVGGRLTNDGLYDQVNDLAPGESTGYALSVPAKDLPVSGPGVYWIGVHVLGTNEQGRLEGADGRARSFIANMPPRGPRTGLALALPLRAPVRRTSDGRLANVGWWNRSLGQDGRLTRLLDMTRSASGVPPTWVVDPATLDAIRSLAEGNPAFDTGPTDEKSSPGPSPGETPSDSAGASPSPSDVPTESPGPLDPDSQDDEPSAKVGQVAAESQRAAAWLTDFRELVTQQTVLALPYADADVASLLRRNFRDVYDRANQLSGAAMQELGIDAKPVVAPGNGLLPNAALPRLDPDTMLLLSRKAAPGTDASSVALRRGPDALLTSDVAKVGGPSPTPAHDALAIRQRILAEAAVRVLDGPGGRPLVVTLPNTWDPGGRWASASFFSGLDVPWIRGVDVPFARVLSHRRPYGPLAYPKPVRRRELPVDNILATQELNRAGSTLADLLTRNDTIDSQVGRAAMLGSSANARARPRRALMMTRRISRDVHHQLDAVTVQGSPLVTMSSGTGNMTVRVVNGLDQPVTVGLDADAGTDGLTIRAPDLVSLGPGQRASVRLAVTATGTGVHSVRITPTTPDGRPLGGSTRIKVRSSQVGLVIWLIMGTGAVVFFAAIGARIVRRVRGRGKERSRGRDQADDREQEDIVS
jgi:hypothetical protein